MRKVIVSLLLFFLLSGNLAWALDSVVSSLPPADAPALQALDDDGGQGPGHADESCNHWCHGGAHLTALATPAGALLPRAGQTLHSHARLPIRQNRATPPNPPPIS